MKPSYKLFFAIPFDSATKNPYNRIGRRIAKKYRFIEPFIGKDKVSPSPTYPDIPSFKTQNRDLTEQIVRQIQDADIVIADLSHNNPNVHVELGVALVQNKNILRVTGRSLTELGFDIRNFEIYQYQNERELIKRICSYLDTFFEIKRLPLKNQYASLYFQEPSQLQLKGATGAKLDVHFGSAPHFIMRDGAVRIGFEFQSAPTEDDWFGFYFRAGEIPWIGSHLLYVRQNGNVTIVRYPYQHEIRSWETKQALSGPQELMAQFENNYLEVQLNQSQPLHTDELSYQSPGRVLPAAWRADVDVHCVEMVSRDTIEWY